MPLYVHHLESGGARGRAGKDVSGTCLESQMSYKALTVSFGVLYERVIEFVKLTIKKMEGLNQSLKITFGQPDAQV